MLTIAGTPTGSEIPQNSAENRFFKIFTNSDFMKYFEVIEEDHKGILEPHSLSLKCNAIKKFIPYDGFYPAERTVELTKQFYDSYSDNIILAPVGGGTGTVSYHGNAPGAGDSSGKTLEHLQQHHRNFLKPLFSPGILYNTIKSGLAVDYPIMTGFFRKHPTILFPDTAGVGKASRRRIQSASFGIFGNSTDISRDEGDHVSGWDARIPFEALIEPEKYLAGVTIFDDEPSDLCNVDAPVLWSGQGDNVYRRMMHNFLAETADFFLRGGQTTGINSRPESKFKPVTPGKGYGMRIKLWRSMDKPKVVSGSWGEFQVPQNTREVIDPKIEGLGIDKFTGGNLVGLVDRSPRENFTMYSRPSAFGPPLGLVSASADQGGSEAAVAFSGSIYDFSPRNGVYCSHTPPYYDGESWIDLIYFPTGLETTQSVDSDYSGDGFFKYRSSQEFLKPYRPDLSEIFASPDPSILYSSASAVPLAGTFIRRWRYDREELKRDEAIYYTEESASTYNVPQAAVQRATYGPASAPWVNKWAMQGDASLNIFDSIKTEDDDTRWRIQTKFETPMLNFNDVKVENGNLTVSTLDSASCCIPRGMWHQFGTLPLEGTGVYMQVTDIPKRWLDNHPSGNLAWDMHGGTSPENKSHRVDKRGQVIGRYRGYSVPIIAGDDVVWTGGTPPEHERSELESLIDVCGFNTDPVRIGEVASRKEVKEAIVAIPFVLEEGERRFFSIPDPREPDNEGFVGKSVADQFSKMQDYVFPPALDFVNNPEVPAVAMYIFEFKHRFDKDDLSHMWQNLPPRLGRSAQEASSVVSHQLLANELMGDWQDLRDTATSRNNFAGENALGGLPEKVRWMIFKVKQKAKTNYWRSLQGKEDEADSFREQTYTHNWPYDFFSMVELAQIEAEIEFGNKEISPTEARLGRDSEESLPAPNQRRRGGRGRGSRGRRRGRQSAGGQAGTEPTLEEQMTGLEGFGQGIDIESDIDIG